MTTFISILTLLMCSRMRYTMKKTLLLWKRLMIIKKQWILIQVQTHKQINLQIHKIIQAQIHKQILLQTHKQINLQTQIVFFHKWSTLIVNCVPSITQAWKFKIKQLSLCTKITTIHVQHTTIKTWYILLLKMALLDKQWFILVFQIVKIIFMMISNQTSQ